MFSEGKTACYEPRSGSYYSVLFLVIPIVLLLYFDVEVPQFVNLPNVRPSVPLRHRRVAILYWGMARAASLVAESHERFLRDPLRAAGLEADVLMHTWRVQEGEPILVWGRDTGARATGEEHLLLKPDEVIVDEQQEFLDALDFTRYYKPGAPPLNGVSGEWRPELLLNHVCALESLRRVTRLAMARGMQVGYEFVIFVRPDARIDSAFDPAWLADLRDAREFYNESTIALPITGHWAGYSDKFAATLFADAEFYGARLDRLDWYRENERFIVSETYCKWAIEQHFRAVAFVPFDFTVVRPNGQAAGSET